MAVSEGKPCSGEMTLGRLYRKASSIQSFVIVSKLMSPREKQLKMAIHLLYHKIGLMFRANY